LQLTEKEKLHSSHNRKWSCFLWKVAVSKILNQKAESEFKVVKFSEGESGARVHNIELPGLG